MAGPIDRTRSHRTAAKQGFHVISDTTEILGMAQSSMPAEFCLEYHDRYKESIISS